MKTFLIDFHPHFETSTVSKNLKIFNNKSIKIKYISFEKTLQIDKFKNIRNKIHYSYEQILNTYPTNSRILEDLDKNKVYKYLDMMLSDPKLISIFERSYFTKFYHTRRIRTISILFFKALNFLRKIKPMAYIMYASPHNINNYIFKWACRVFNIDVIYIQESLLPWRHYIMVEKDNGKYCC